MNEVRRLKTKSPPVVAARLPIAKIVGHDVHHTPSCLWFNRNWRSADASIRDVRRDGLRQAPVPVHFSRRTTWRSGGARRATASGSSARSTASFPPRTKWDRPSFAGVRPSPGSSRSRSRRRPATSTPSMGRGLRRRCRRMADRGAGQHRRLDVEAGQVFPSQGLGHKCPVVDWQFLTVPYVGPALSRQYANGFRYHHGIQRWIATLFPQHDIVEDILLRW